MRSKEGVGRISAYRICIDNLKSRNLFGIGSGIDIARFGSLIFGVLRRVYAVENLRTFRFNSMGLI